MAKDIRDLIVVGGGASGMLTGLLSARNGLSVSILEHGKTLGKKLAITGNGKCNFTNLYQEKSCYNSGDIKKAYNPQSAVKYAFMRLNLCMDRCKIH